MTAANAIDNPEEYLYQPLWCVYGADSFPDFLCFRLNERNGEITIWGYSVWKRRPGFRTLGLNFKTFRSALSNPKFFDNHDHALAYLKKITTPKCSAID